MRRLALPLLLAVGCALVAWLGFFYFRDDFSTHYPIKVLSAHAFRAGELPYWNFADGGGQPLAGNPNTLTFYPDNVLYLFLPPHAAFNLHFILHLIAAWFAMRALTRSRWAAWVYVLSGVAISATAFYNIVAAVALIPFALWAAHRCRPLLLGCAFGLLGLAGEPVTLLAAALMVGIVAFGRMRAKHWAIAIVLAIVIASPQLVATSEIAKEVERAHGFSTETTLNASLYPLRLLELAIPYPFDLGRPRLFLLLFFGAIAVPALLQRSRYVAAFFVLLFFALGRYNPIVSWVVDALPSLRIVRYPEKLALPMVVALAVLAAPLLERRTWRWATLVPLALAAVFVIPIDWFAPYDAPFVSPQRIFRQPTAGGQLPIRADYRKRAALREPLFGAVSGLRYVLNRSGDGMHSLLSRIANERYLATHNERYLRIAAGLPPAFVVPRVVGVRSVNEAVGLIEGNAFDERTSAIAPSRWNGFTSDGRVTSYRESVQSIEIGVAGRGPMMLFVNQSFFTAWDAGGLPIVPLDLDRLGVVVPAGVTHVTLRFGRHRTLVVAAWVVSSLLLLAGALRLRLEVFDRRAGEVERAADEDGARVGA